MKIKILSLFFTVFFLIFSSTCVSSAATTQLKEPPKELLKKYYCYYLNGNGDMRLITSDNIFYLYQTDDNIYWSATYDKPTYLPSGSDDIFIYDGSNNWDLYSKHYHNSNIYLSNSGDISTYKSNFYISVYSNSGYEDFRFLEYKEIAGINLTSSFGNFVRTFKNNINLLVIIGISILAVFISLPLIKKVIYRYV